ncbi:MAG: hypothetical protein IT258_10345, partial [Saprospiraceae bacterium]|nr:hypothetical protein [Saprospiraceae bacterium]
MKTSHTAIFLLLFALPQLAVSQNAWKDADLLNKWFEFDPVRFRAEVDNSVEVDEERIMEIIANYCPEAIKMEVEAGGVVQRVNLNICFQGNPFISLQQYAQSDFSNILPVNFKPETHNSGGQVTPGGRGPSGGNLITNLADGLAIFLARRTKEELNATFFEGLRRKLDEEPTYRALFPATYDLVYVIGDEIYNYNAYLESLREVFLKDLEVLPINLRQYSQDHNLVKKAEFQIAIEDLLATTQMILDAQKPRQIMDYWANNASMQDSLRWSEISNEKTRKAMQDMAMSMKSLHLLVRSLTSDSGAGWVPSNEIGVKMRDISHTYLYLGLLW